MFKFKRRRRNLSIELLGANRRERQPFQIDRVLVFLLLFVASASILSQAIFEEDYVPEPGDVAERDVFAPRGFIYQDYVSAEKRWKREFDARPAPYFFDTAAFEVSLAELDRQIAGNFTDDPAAPSAEPGAAEERVRKIREAVDRIAKGARTRGLLDRSHVPERRLEILSKDDTRIVEAGSAIQPGEWSSFLSDIPAADEQALIPILNKYLQPTLRYDEKRAEEAWDEIKRRIPPLQVRYEAEQPLIMSGQELTENDVDLLRQLRESLRRQNFVAFAAMIVFLWIVLWFAAVYLRRYHPALFRRFRDIVAIAFVFGAVLLSCLVVQIVIQRVDFQIVTFSNAALPVSTAAMALALIYGARTGFFVSMLLSAVVASVLAPRLTLLVIFVFGNMVGALLAADDRKRTDLIKTGAWTALVQIVVAACLGFIHNTPFGSIRIDVISAAISGLLASLLTPFILLPLEAISRRSSAFRLLELADLNHPLLQAMLHKTPGTFQHSQHVALLAQAAAEEIGADSLLTRVGAYFHDIGKMRKPEYYTENQTGDENPHDRLKPSLSASIVRSHVSDGVQIAIENKLPEAVIDFIREHHGTSLMNVFYHRALELAGEDGGVDKTDYRYPGPKPQTPETAILMLADTVEAATRSLVKPSVQRIEQLVRKLIIERFESGELNECEVTLKDLNFIAESFTHVLSAMHHSRVEYPEAEEIAAAERKGRGEK